MSMGLSTSVRPKRLRVMALGMAALLSGCAVFVPEHLWGIDPNLYVTSVTPGRGSSVAYGTPISVKLKYRIDPFQEGRRHYILLCGQDTLKWESTCGTTHEHVFEVVKPRGTVSLSFPFSESTRWAVLVARQPKVVQCAPNNAWCTHQGTLGAADLYLFPLAH